jgi:hypothetical protein
MLEHADVTVLQAIFQSDRIDDPVIYLTLDIEDMSQSRYAPRALDTQGHQGKEGRVHIFPSSHSKNPRFQSTIADPCLQRRHAMHECRTHSTTSFPTIIPENNHESWPSWSTMDLKPPCLDLESDLEIIMLDQRERIASN